VKIPLRRLDPELSLPQRAHPGDAGIDLRSAETVKIPPEGWLSVGTGVAVAIPDGHVGLVSPRSGLAARHGIGVANGPGIVDAGYRGELRVLLINHGGETVAIERGERIAQLVVVPMTEIEFDEVDELPPSSRGDGGFGSSGRH
jgi:dUTP pyrophosphatase